MQRVVLAAPVARVACCTRRRVWLTTMLARRIAWKWSTTTLAWPSGVTSALAYPRLGSRATMPTWASQPCGRAPSQPSTAALVWSATRSTGRPPIGRSRTRTTRRPGVPRTPQPAQPTTLAVVWTASCHSPPHQLGRDDLQADQVQQ
jgi:hypothetical protein